MLYEAAAIKYYNSHQRKYFHDKQQDLLETSKAVGESRVPVSRPKASSPGRKKLMLDTRKYKIFALFMWKLELPVIWDFPAAEII